LLCHHLNEPISRLRDQSAGGGNVFAVAMDARRVLHGWLMLEHDSVGLARNAGLS
jgi:hypothetical protein